MYLNFFFVFIVVLVLSCSALDETKLTLPEFHVELQSDSLFFRLDDETSFQMEEWRVNPDLQVLSFFNPMNRSIYIYETGKENYRLKIPIQREGPNAIRRVSQTYLHSLDSIFVLSAIENHTAYLIDSLGNVISEYVLSNRQKEEHFTSGSLQFGKQDFYFSEGKLFLTVMPRGENYRPKEKYPSLLIFDTHTGEKQYVVNFPKRFNELNFGSFQGMSHGLLHPISKKFILSFPYHHNLLTWDIASGIESEISNSNPYVRVANFSVPEDGLEMQWYGFYFGWYDRMLHNPIHNTIWRMASVGRDFEKDQNVNDPSIKNIHGGKEQFYTFIYDQDLNLSGYVKEFLHYQPILFHDGKMYKKVPNLNPETAENILIFRSFELLRSDMSN